MAAELNVLGVGAIETLVGCVTFSLHLNTRTRGPVWLETRVLLSEKGPLCATDCEGFKKFFAEHVENKLGFYPVLIVDNDQRVVVDIRRFALVFKFCEVHSAATRGIHPNRRSARDPIHKVKVMTAFLHQGTARIRRKFVPLADFSKKRRSVLAKAYCVDRP